MWKSTVFDIARAASRMGTSIALGRPVVAEVYIIIRPTTGLATRSVGMPERKSSRVVNPGICPSETSTAGRAPSRCSRTRSIRGLNLSCATSAPALEFSRMYETSWTERCQLIGTT